MPEWKWLFAPLEETEKFDWILPEWHMRCWSATEVADVYDADNLILLWFHQHLHRHDMTANLIFICDVDAIEAV